LLAACAASLAACNVATLSNDGVDGAKDTDVFDRVRSIDLMPRYPKQVQQTQPGRDKAKPAIYVGETDAAADATTSAPPNSAAPSGDGYDLNFESAPVTTVAKVILGDILGVGYTIDSRVQGTISLSSGRPVPRSDIAYVL